MSIQTWPSSLPKPERKTWSRTSQDVRRKRTPQNGASGYAKAYSKSSKQVSLSVVLSRAETAVFDNFFHEACSEGSLLFWMPDPTTDGWPMLTSEGQQILTADGAPLLMSSTWLCTWGDDLPVQTVEGQVQFRMSFSVVVVPS